MSIELVKVSKMTRGKNSHEVNFNAIGRFESKVVNKESEVDGKTVITPTETKVLVTDGILTSLEDALSLVGGDTQKLLDNFAIGFNKNAYDAESAKDELDPYVQGLSAEMADATKRAIRALAKATGLEIAEAAEIVSASRPK